MDISNVKWLLVRIMAEFYIKASEAARRIGVSLVTAKRMINDNRLIGQKIGSRWHVTVGMILIWEKCI